MTAKTQVINPLHAIIQSQLQEIIDYKWLESEKAGHDIGWDSANNEWNNKHFTAWRHHTWDLTSHKSVSMHACEPFLP